VTGAATGISQSDPDAALRFIEPYRGQPEYDQAFGNVVTRIAQNDPLAAARLLATAPPSAQANSAATMIARNWAARDPVAAAQFVMTLPDARVQSTAARSVADAWARTDADAAQRWVLSLPSGALRDDALNGYLNSAAAAGVLDTRVLAAFSNDRDRDNAVSSAIGQIGRTNLPEARRLLEQHVTDPDLRRRTEELLARTGGTGSSSGNFVIDLIR
jgi:hypothetical protein